MKTIKENLPLFLLVLISVLMISIRMEYSETAMDSRMVNVFVDSGKSYTTTLNVKSDPRSSNFAVDFIGVDTYLDRRVLVSSSWETRSVILGLKVGEKVKVTGHLEHLNEYQKYLKREHIVAEFVIESVYKIYPNKSFTNNATQSMRDVIATGCSKLQPSEMGVCEALLIGKRDSIDKELYETYKKSQLTHLLVASGANIAFLVGFVKPLLSRMRRNYSSIVLIFIALFYCTLTRFEPSILRASVMVIIPTLLSMRGIGISNIKLFLFTLLGCSILDPYLLFRVGFWLSLFASGGLIFLSPKLKSFIKSEIVRNTISATICVQPILWLVFGFELPLRWWASVIGIIIGESITTFGMVVVIITGVLVPQGVITELLLVPLQIACSGLNSIATIGASSYSIPIGYVATMYLILSYALKCPESTFKRRVKRICRINSSTTLSEKIQFRVRKI